MDGDPMGTLTEAIEGLQADGFTGNWFATADHLLRCSECGEDADPRSVTVEHTFRFEGQSDPDDAVILYALSEPGGRRGVYSAQYGASMPAEDAAVIALLRHRPTDGPSASV